MRISRAVAVLTVGLLITAAGCSRTVDGTAQSDPRKPGVVVSDDGHGIVAGFDDAPVNVEIFTEPQCNHCADLQADFGDDIARYLNIGQLAVTYRPLTFLDDVRRRIFGPGEQRVVPGGGSRDSATAFQAFVEELYAQQRPLTAGPSNGEIADMARESGMPAAVVDRIAGGEPALDVVDMGDSNFGYLFGLNPLDPGTPTVYDPSTDEILDIYDNNWLSKLMASA